MIFANGTLISTLFCHGVAYLRARQAAKRASTLASVDSNHAAGLPPFPEYRRGVHAPFEDTDGIGIGTFLWGV
jgi:hypothetical protein